MSDSNAAASGGPGPGPRDRGSPASPADTQLPGESAAPTQTASGLGLTAWLGETVVPGQVGPYRLLERIGAGGMGEVYKAERRAPMHQVVALKLIKPGMDTREVVARFEAERQALALMSHPNIARVLDAGSTDAGRPYFVMEYVPGEPITEYCDRHKLTTQQRLELFCQACDAVHHAHQKAVIHRDIKPTNVLVTAQDGKPQVKVIDFGLAKALGQRLVERTMFTARGQFVGTPEYMSPEQAVAGAGGADVDTRADIYGLGVLLYQLLTGVLPFDPLDMREAAYDEMLRTIREVEPPRPSTRLGTLGEEGRRIAACRSTDFDSLHNQLRRELEWVPLKAMRKERSERYRSAAELADDIQNYLHVRPLIAGPRGRLYPVRKFARKHARAVTASASALAVLLALVVGLVLTTRWALRARRDEAGERGKATVAARNAETERNAAQHERNAAQQQRNVAQQERNAARVAELHATSLLARRYVREGQAYLDKGENSLALLHFVEALRVGPSDADAVRNHRLRVASTLAICTQLCHTEVPWFTRPNEQADQRRNRVFRALSQPGRGIVPTRDGLRAAVIDGKVVTVFDTATARPITRAMPLASVVTRVHFSPNERRLLIMGESDPVQVWNADTGEAVGEPMHHSDRINMATFSANGRRVGTASNDGTARVWDAATGLPVTEPLRHAQAVSWIAFDSTSGRVVTTSNDRTAQVWETQGSKKLPTTMQHDAIVNRAAFSNDGRCVVTVTDDWRARVWDSTLALPLTPYLHHCRFISDMEFSPDNHRIASLTSEKIVRVWDIHGSPPRLLGLMPRGPYHLAALSRDARHVLIGSANGSFRVWDTATGEPASPPMVHPSVSVAAFSPNSRRIATGGSDGTVRVWDVATGQSPNPSTSHLGAVEHIAFSPSGERIVTASADATALIWDAATGQPITSPLRHGKFRLSDAEFSPDGSRVVTAGLDPTARVWDAATGKAALDPLRHGGAIQAVAYSRNGRRIVTAGWNQIAQVWDAHTGKAIGRPMPHQQQVWQVEFSPDSERVATATRDGTARVWDASTGLPITPPLRGAGQLAVTPFSTDGRHLLTRVNDGARMWDAFTGEQLTPMIPPGPIGKMLVAFTPNSRQVVVLYGLGNVGAWNVPEEVRPTEDLRALAELLSSHRIDDTGAAVHLSTSEWNQRWDDLTRRYPNQFPGANPTTAPTAGPTTAP